MPFLRTLGAVFGGIALLAAILACNTSICFADGEDYLFFCGNTSSDCRIVEGGANPALTKLTLGKVCGECASYDELDVEQFLLSADARVLFTERLSDSVNYYCTADLPYSVELYGAQINLHVCVKEGKVIVASPIIFGGY